MLVAQGDLQVWAITEDADEHEAILLLPLWLEPDAPLMMTRWGHPGIQKVSVVRSETLSLPQIELFRVMVRYEDWPAAGIPIAIGSEPHMSRGG